MPQGALSGCVYGRHDVNDCIYSAISVYLIMAVVWGAAYMLLATIQPAAFSMDITRHGNRVVFFSLVTLTTIGYGDIVPMTAQACSLSILKQCREPCTWPL